MSFWPGGADVAAGSLAAYGAISAVVSVIIWQYIGKLDRTSDVLVAVGAGIAMILGPTSLSGADRYVDSVLVLVGCAIVVPQVAALLRTAMVELLEGAPNAQVQAHVHDVTTAIRDEFGLAEPALTRTHATRIHFCSPIKTFA